MTAETESITIKVAAGTYYGDIVIGTARSLDTVTTTTYQDAEGKALGTVTTVNEGAKSLYDLSGIDLSKLKLNIVAEDAGEDLLSAGSGAVICGNITIEGIQTVLSGHLLFPRTARQGQGTR